MAKVIKKSAPRKAATKKTATKKKAVSKKASPVSHPSSGAASSPASHPQPHNNPPPAPLPAPPSSSGGSSAGRSQIRVRMYRPGTGDFFLIRFSGGPAKPFYLMIDCGCIQAGKDTFTPGITDLVKETGGVIDLLVITHEHADHINGFQLNAAKFDKIDFKKVWFAWTEDKSDPIANNYRKNYTGMKMALAAAATQLQGLSDSRYFQQQFRSELNGKQMLDGQEHFVRAVAELDALNLTVPVEAGKPQPTMADLLTTWKVIKPTTEVEFLSPGELRDQLDGLPNIRIFVLGPPKDLDSLKLEGKTGVSYDKRQNPSQKDFAFMMAMNHAATGLAGNLSPFDHSYEDTEKEAPPRKSYQNKNNGWRSIDHDWLNSAGGLALRFQSSINNTSLALAFQFEDSEKVLLFPGDAEYGNWASWQKLSWSMPIKGGSKKVDANYLLNKTVFYKVGHHLSQNGTDKDAVTQMTSGSLAAMATLDFKKINNVWLNTMPNDLLGSDLIRRTAGKLFFAGDCARILKNIKTTRVTVQPADEKNLDAANKAFDNIPYIDYVVEG